jgi:hypothetical protein
MYPRLALGLIALASATNCASPQAGSGADGGSVDASSVDASSIDAGSGDAGTMDSGIASDAGPDSGWFDAGLRDAGAGDSGTSDAGPMVFAWIFGYLDNQFLALPDAGMGLSQNDILMVVENLSAQVGGPDRLEVGPAIDFVNAITSGHYSEISQYVASLRQYSGRVFARVNDLDNSPAVASQVALCVQLGANAIWFDHIDFFKDAGTTAGSALMDSFADQYADAGITFILNYDNAPKTAVPAPGARWPAVTYVSPTTASGTDDQIDFADIQTLNGYFPGRVLLHLDANPAGSVNQPMNVFAEQDAGTEIATVLKLLQLGKSPADAGQGFSFLVPVVGSWTSDLSPYQGTLYNGLAIGVYPRDTFPTLLPSL